MQIRKVLAVDDSDLIHRMYHFFLQSYGGAELISVANGREALDRLIEFDDVDLILLDINMPVMNGIQFLEAVQEKPEYQHIPIVVISTEGKEEDTVRALRLGANGYLVKPFNATNLQKIIGSVLQKSGIKAQANGPRG